MIKDLQPGMPEFGDRRQCKPPVYRSPDGYADGLKTKLIKAKCNSMGFEAALSCQS